MTIHRGALAVLSIASVILCTSATAQRDAGELKQKLADKLSQEWVANAAWLTDFDKAKAEARQQGKQIFGYFTRSYSP